MASSMGLVRSFYGWLARTRKALESSALTERISSLPAQYPTSLSAVVPLALQAARVLQGTEFSAKASYWARLFEQIQSEGWKGEVRSVDIDRLNIRRELAGEDDGCLALQDSRP